VLFSFLFSFLFSHWFLLGGSSAQIITTFK
jgi:hypothetical protein